VDSTVQDAGSRAIVLDTNVAASGTRPTRLSFSTAYRDGQEWQLAGDGHSAVVVQDAGITSTSRTQRSEAPRRSATDCDRVGGLPSYGGSSTTKPRRAGLYVSNGTIVLPPTSKSRPGKRHSWAVLAGDLNGPDHAEWRDRSRRPATPQAESSFRMASCTAHPGGILDVLPILRSDMAQTVPWAWWPTGRRLGCF